VNVNQKQNVAAQYKIQGVPTVVMFHKGKIVMRLTGALPYEDLKAEVKKPLN